MKEIGGYFEIEINHGSEYYSDALAVDCGRNAAVLVAQMRDYKKINIPDFMCRCVKDAYIHNGIEVESYIVGEDFRPIFDKELKQDEAIYIVNYYGQLRDYISQARTRWNNLILDNAQDFFFKNENVDCVYTCRKFFGVPDGGYITTPYNYDKSKYDELEQDISCDRMHCVLGRFEKTASEFYSESIVNNDRFIGQPVRKMSKLTHNILRGIDYNAVSQKRKDNFSYLHNRLKDINYIKNINVIDGAFMYPFRTKNAKTIRESLIKSKIYIPKLWPDVENTGSAKALADEILPVPCDQRYDTQDMDYIISEILRAI